ncbi:MAG: type II toxin-antitoxin system YafQ family toxin [Synergistaceae bacterium]|nr:type II toxin-antitoxin system YafQ family toxin [Synergistaceae bacterium]
MRSVRRSAAFKRDLKRESKGRFRSVLKKELADIVADLASDISLPEKYHDHILFGKWTSCRECHLKPDLLLIYLKDNSSLHLLRLGSHDELLEKQ